MVLAIYDVKQGLPHLHTISFDSNVISYGLFSRKLLEYAFAKIEDEPLKEEYKKSQTQGLSIGKYKEVFWVMVEGQPGGHLPCGIKNSQARGLAASQRKWDRVT